MFCVFNFLFKGCLIQQKYVRSSSQTLTFACNKYAQEVKYHCFQSRIISEGHLYLLIVFESFGGISGDAFEFTKNFFQRISTIISEPKCIVAKSLYENLSCALMTSTASKYKYENK